MSLVAHAKKELELLEQQAQADGDSRDTEMQQKMNNDVLRLVEEFANQGHSGFSANYAARLFERLVSFKPLAPLTGDESEWIDQSDVDDRNIQQNNRRPSVFRTDNDNSTAYDIDGRVFSDDGGETYWSGNGSAVPITFPYTPPEEPEKIIINKEDS